MELLTIPDRAWVNQSQPHRTSACRVQKIYLNKYEKSKKYPGTRDVSGIHGETRRWARWSSAGKTAMPNDSDQDHSLANTTASDDDTTGNQFFCQENTPLS